MIERSCCWIKIHGLSSYHTFSSGCDHIMVFFKAWKVNIADSVRFGLLLSGSIRYYYC